ncbi:four helix bundle protein [Cerasicoccus maritimus]|uniref:four helix bundle protein n=1 Tax=Cerasicoccus maritimus TaxID=490089 RepID=UPI002852A7DB|nr:four helix bundle protein [Cerasicoccus maritimus]
MIDKFEDIQAWQAARELTKQIYLLCQDEALASDFGLRDQIRRSAVSIGSNIAEGYGRNSRAELIRFLRISQGSAYEFRSQLYTLLDANYIDAGTFQRLHDLSVTSANLIGGFLRYLEKSKANRS